MRYGLTTPNFGDYGSPGRLVDMAVDAEAAGWDGFFLWDHVQHWPGAGPVVDPWVALAAVAQATERIRLGPMVTPVSRRRPTKLARETVTLDHLSGGRLVFGAGLGAPADRDFAHLGEVHDDRARAAMLDEGLDLLAALWAGTEVTHRGAHYTVDGATFLPRPVQQPRIPVWVAGFWPNRPPFRRAARWDGAFPIKLAPSGDDVAPMEPADVAALLDLVAEHRTTEEPFDVVLAGPVPDDAGAAAELLGPLAAAGVTWYLEAVGDPDLTYAQWRERVAAGPPEGLP